MQVSGSSLTGEVISSGSSYNVCTTACYTYRVLVTGAGTLGTEIVKGLMDLGVEVIRVLDNSEEALWRLEEAIRPNRTDTQVRLLLGDIRDKERVSLAMKTMDTVFHTAALKHVRFTNYNPMECIKTDIEGTTNIVMEAMESRSVQALCNMSSDKAALPNNIYGECKRVGERIVTWGFNVSKKDMFSVRCGNFIGSRGSVLDRWDEQRRTGKIILTDRHMNRFFIKPSEAANFLITSTLLHANKVRGSVTTPYLKNFNMGLLADAYANLFDVKVEEIGAQEGEKLDEVIISDEEASRTEQHEDIGWITRYFRVDNPVLGAISTAVVPTAGPESTERYLRWIYKERI